MKKLLSMIFVIIFVFSTRSVFAWKILESKDDFTDEISYLVTKDNSLGLSITKDRTLIIFFFEGEKLWDWDLTYRFDKQKAVILKATDFIQGKSSFILIISDNKNDTKFKNLLENLLKSKKIIAKTGNILDKRLNVELELQGLKEILDTIDLNDFHIKPYLDKITN